MTTEANPESVTPESLAALRAGGFTRISFGMQSVVPHVLATLDRQHTPGRAAAAVAEARAAGFEHVSVDLIYGTPGESDDDWRASLAAAVETGVDHVSAYSLIVEPGTRLAARVARGELPMTDDDVLADRYAMADEALSDGRTAVVRGVELGAVGRCTGPAQPALLDRRRLVGRRARGAQPCRRACGGGTSSIRASTRPGSRPASRRPPRARCCRARDREVEDIMLRLRLRSGLPLARLGSAARAGGPGRP